MNRLSDIISAYYEHIQNKGLSLGYPHLARTVSAGESSLLGITIRVSMALPDATDSHFMVTLLI